MPSPVGHALGGAIVGLLADRPTRSAHTYRTLGWLAVAANAPDLDFLWGRHAAETHSIGAAVLAGLLVFAITRGRGRRLAVLVTLAWLSHIVLDWLGSDTTPPIGVMALWPFTEAYFFAHAYVFDAISRRYWLPNFWTHNVIAVAKEILLLGPITGLVAWWRLKRVRGGSARFG